MSYIKVLLSVFFGLLSLSQWFNYDMKLVQKLIIITSLTMQYTNKKCCVCACVCTCVCTCVCVCMYIHLSLVMQEAHHDSLQKNTKLLLNYLQGIISGIFLLILIYNN